MLNFLSSFSKNIFLNKFVIVFVNILGCYRFYNTGKDFSRSCEPSAEMQMFGGMGSSSSFYGQEKKRA